MTTICFTGHRTIEGKYFDRDNLNGHWFEIWNTTVQIVHKLWEEGYTTFISGGALGFDQLAARAVIFHKNSIPPLPIQLYMALPFKGFEHRWPAKSKSELVMIISRADYLSHICEDDYAPWKLQKRNEWMVDNSDKVVALYLPNKTGGTLNCLHYTMKQHKPILTIHPLTRNIVPIKYDHVTKQYIVEVEGQ